MMDEAGVEVEAAVLDFLVSRPRTLEVVHCERGVRCTDGLVLAWEDDVEAVVAEIDVVVLGNFNYWTSLGS